MPKAVKRALSALFSKINYSLTGQNYFAEELKRPIGWSIVTAALTALFWGIYYSVTGKYNFEMNAYFFAPWVREMCPWLINRFWDIIFAPIVVGAAVLYYEHEKTDDLDGNNFFNSIIGAIFISAGALMGYTYMVFLLVTVIGSAVLAVAIIWFFVKRINAIIDNIGTHERETE